MVEEMRSERDRLFRELGTIPGLRVYPSAANFLVFRVTSARVDHVEVFSRLLHDHGVLVRDVSKYPQLERCLRVNAGTPEENGVFLAALRGIMEEG
jgi:histidinol-phosphate aminotransferase